MVKWLLVVCVFLLAGCMDTRGSVRAIDGTEVKTEVGGMALPNATPAEVARP